MTKFEYHGVYSGLEFYHYSVHRYRYIMKTSVAREIHKFDVLDLQNTIPTPEQRQRPWR